MPRTTNGDASTGTIGKGQYGKTLIAASEYGEVLLLDRAQRRIIRAFPLPGLPPQHLVVTGDAVFCERQGDGGLPDSMLCRISRHTYRWMVRVFPSTIDSGFNPVPRGRYVPANWKVDKPVARPIFTTISWRGGTLRVGDSVIVDPVTLRVG